jgi:hypothetical protein
MMRFSVGPRYGVTPNSQFEGRFRTRKVLGEILRDPRKLIPDDRARISGLLVYFLSYSFGPPTPVGLSIASAAGLGVSGSGVIYNRLVEDSEKNTGDKKSDDKKSGDIQ